MFLVVRKALAYVTRGDELLVFLHRDFPDAGIQVPSGTVEEGEITEQAALRELYEESGLDEVRIVRFLGRDNYYGMAAIRGEVWDRYAYHMELTGDAPSKWLHFESHASGGHEPIAFCFFWMSLSDPGLRLSGGKGDFLDYLGKPAIDALRLTGKST